MQPNTQPGTTIQSTAERSSVQNTVSKHRAVPSLTTQARAELSSNSTVDSTTHAVHPDCISGASLCFSGASRLHLAYITIGSLGELTTLHPLAGACCFQKSSPSVGA